MDFRSKKITGVIHLLPLPGAPLYDGNMRNVIRTALRETAIYEKYGVDAIIVENFRDAPFYKDRVPAETIAAMSVVSKAIVENFSGELGINVLRNDALSAMAIATSTGAGFIRVNVHSGAMLTDQGIVEGKAAETLRLKRSLQSQVQIFADVAVKHAAPLAARPLDEEVKDVTERGLADAVIVSGSRTGSAVDLAPLKGLKSRTSKPVLLGSGVNIDNFPSYYDFADGFIIGSYFKTGGRADNFVEEKRVAEFMESFRSFQ